MDLAFPWPSTTGEQIAFTVAGITVLIGLLYLFAPRVTLRLLRLSPSHAHPEAVGTPRSLSGFYLGVGLCCIITGQFWVYLALGFSWAFTAFGRIVAMMSDRGSALYHGPLLSLEALLAILPLLYVMGLLP